MVSPSGLHAARVGSASAPIEMAGEYVLAALRDVPLLEEGPTASRSGCEASRSPSLRGSSDGHGSGRRINVASQMRLRRAPALRRRSPRGGLEGILGAPDQQLSALNQLFEDVRAMTNVVRRYTNIGPNGVPKKGLRIGPELGRQQRFARDPSTVRTRPKARERSQLNRAPHAHSRIPRNTATHTGGACLAPGCPGKRCKARDVRFRHP